MKIFEIIKFEGPNDVFVWKHPIEDFNTQSQLIVNANQEAILFKNGEALDSFGPGRHTLSTDNVPLLKSLISLPFGGKTPFSCQVYFINKITSMNFRWGTDAPISVEDPKYQIFVKIKANGQMSVKVEDARKLVLKLVGQISEFNHQTLQDYFRGLMMTKIKEKIASIMINRNISFLEVSVYYGEVSNLIKEELTQEFETYGFKLVNFYINNISVNDEDFAKLKASKEDVAITRTTADAEAYKTIKEGEAMAKSREVQGYSYQDERSYAVLEKAAKNEGTSGTLMGAGMGLGMGIGMGGPIGRNIGGLAQTYLNGEQKAAKPQEKAVSKFMSVEEENLKEFKFCINCGYKNVKAAKFCMECGTKIGE